MIERCTASGIWPDAVQSSTSAIEKQDTSEINLNCRAAFPVVYFLRRRKSQRPNNPTMAKATGAVRWRLISTTSFRFCSHSDEAADRRRGTPEGGRPGS